MENQKQPYELIKGLLSKEGSGEGDLSKKREVIFLIDFTALHFVI